MKTPENNENEENFEHFNKSQHEGAHARSEEEYNEAEPRHKFNFKDFKVEDIANKVLEYIQANNEQVDKDKLLKYAAIAVLGLYGLRSSGFLGNVLVSAAVALIAKNFLLSDFEKEYVKRETAKA